MTSDNETQQRIQELQILEHNLQNILMQKQAFQLELNETLNALEEVKKTSDSIYKILGSIMIKTDKQKISSELENKKKILELRLQTLERQEKLLESKAKEIQEKAQKAFKKQESK